MSSLEPNRKGRPKTSKSTASLFSRTVSSQSVKAKQKEAWSPGKWRTPTPRNQCRQQTSIQHRTRVVCTNSSTKIPSVENLTPVVSNSWNTFTSLPEHLYKGSKLPIPNTQLGRNLQVEDATIVTSAETQNGKNDKSEAQTKSKVLTDKYPGKSKIHLLVRDKPPKPKKGFIKTNPPSLQRQSTYDIPGDVSQKPKKGFIKTNPPSLQRQSTYDIPGDVSQKPKKGFIKTNPPSLERQTTYDIPGDVSQIPSEIYIPLQQLTLINQKVSELRSVLATMQRKVNTVEKSIKEEIAPCDDIGDSVLSKTSLKSNFESMGKNFEIVDNILSQQKTLIMKTIGLYKREMLPRRRDRKPILPPRDETFLVSDESKKKAVKITSVVGGSQVVIKRPMDISQSKDEETTDGEVLNKMDDVQSNWIGDFVAPPWIHSNIQRIIIEAIGEIDGNPFKPKAHPFKPKAHEMVMGVLAEALQYNQTMSISDINPRTSQETVFNINDLDEPIMGNTLRKEENINVLELEFSLQDDSRKIDDVAPSPSFTISCYLNDLLDLGSFKRRTTNSFVGEYSDQTEMVSNVLQKSYAEVTKIGRLNEIEYLKENTSVGSDQDQRVSSQESKISEVIDSNENDYLQSETPQLNMLTKGSKLEEDVNMVMIDEYADAETESAPLSMLAKVSRIVEVTGMEMIHEYEGPQIETRPTTPTKTLSEVSGIETDSSMEMIDKNDGLQTGTPLFDISAKVSAIEGVTSMEMVVEDCGSQSESPPLKLSIKETRIEDDERIGTIDDSLQIEIPSLEILTPGSTIEESPIMEMIENVRESSRTSIKTPENVADVMMEG